MRKIKNIITALALTLTLAAGTGCAYAETGNASQAEAAAPVVTAKNIQAKAVKIKDAAPNGYNSIKVTWNELTGVDGYQVYRAASKSGKYYKAVTVSRSKTYAVDTNRTTGKRYYYKVRGYKRVDGKLKFSKFSAVQSSYARPSKTVMQEAYGSVGSIAGGITLTWKAVKGASGYEPQLREFKNGKWSKWKSYTYDKTYERNNYFMTYTKLLALNKQRYPSGYMTIIDGEKADGTPIVKTVTVKEGTRMPKNMATIRVEEDKTVYQFRVRPYTLTKSGKKVYGLYSNPFELKETLDVDEIYSALRKHAIDYAAKNFPAWKYDDNTEGRTPENSAYYTDGVMGAFSRYARQEDVIKGFKESVGKYINRMKNFGGQEDGFLFIRLAVPGGPDGFHPLEGTESYYKVWMLY